MVNVPLSFIFLLEIPVPTVKAETQWLDVFPTESVTMSCGMEQDATNWTYAWYRDGKKVQDYNSKNDVIFNINSASASDKGPYSCLGKLKSRDVYSKSSSVLKLHVYGEICFHSLFFFLKKCALANGCLQSLQFDLRLSTVVQLLLWIIFNPQKRNLKSLWSRIPSTIWCTLKIQSLFTVTLTFPLDGSISGTKMVPRLLHLEGITASIMLWQNTPVHIHAKLKEESKRSSIQTWVRV